MVVLNITGPSRKDTYKSTPNYQNELPDLAERESNTSGFWINKAHDSESRIVFVYCTGIEYVKHTGFVRTM